LTGERWKPKGAAVTRNTASVLLCILACASGVQAAGPPDPAPFDAVLAARVRKGGFDYRGTAGQDRKRLSAYLANLGEANPAGMSPEEKKAFFINAYNAMAIDVVLEKYPVKSIMDIDGAFKKIKRRVGGETLTLDEIENKLRSMGDPRFHFAIVCASESCPPLAERAYPVEGLSAALEKQGRAFVNDSRRNVIDRSGNRVALSKIFDWNRKEFEREAGSIVKYVSKFAKDPATAAWLVGYPKEPEFLEYDWKLNQP